MALPFDQQKTQSGNSIFEDVYVYGCLYVSNSCGVIFTSPNGTRYSIVATDSGIQFGNVGIGGGGSGSSVTTNSISLVNNDGDTYNISATTNGIAFQTPDTNGDGEPDNGYIDIKARNITATGIITATGSITGAAVTANSFTRVSGLTSEYLMADGSVSRRYVGVGVGSTPGGSGGTALGNNGDIWYTLC